MDIHPLAFGWRIGCAMRMSDAQWIARHEVVPVDANCKGADIPMNRKLNGALKRKVQKLPRGLRCADVQACSSSAWD